MLSLPSLLARGRPAHVFLYMRPRPLWYQTSPLHLQVPARFPLPQQPTHRTFASSLRRRDIPPTAKEERKARFRRFTLARLGWTLVIVSSGGVLFAGAELYLYKKETKEIWESVKSPFGKGWEGVKLPFRKGEDGWVGWRERKKEEQLRKDKKWSERILSSMIEYQERKQSHEKWLDTLTLTVEERKVAGKEAMMDRALEMIERDTITEKNWPHFLAFYKKCEEVQGTTGETNQALEQLAVEQIEEYNKWADGLNLGAEERTLLDKLRRLALREN
jgi:hypothetical protein